MDIEVWSGLAGPSTLLGDGDYRAGIMDRKHLYRDRGHHMHDTLSKASNTDRPRTPFRFFPSLRRRTVCMGFLLGFLAAAPLVAAQLFDFGLGNEYGGVDGSEFVFARLRYTEGLSSSFGGFGRRGGSWSTDWPKADKQFIFAIDRMSNVRVVLDQDVAIDIMDPRLFSFPFVYALEVGRGMNLSTEEAERLREYMERGGFVVIDDFWGTRQWQNFARELQKIFPDREPEELPLSHPLFHAFFDIPEIVQVPGVQAGCSGGPTYQQDGYVPYALAIFDESRRPMMVINFNTDLGDAWEWADRACYPNEYATFAFRMGINFIVYSMTH